MGLRTYFSVVRGFRFTEKQLKPEIKALMDERRCNLDELLFDFLKSEKYPGIEEFSCPYDFAESCPMQFRTHEADDGKMTFFIAFKDQSIEMSEDDEKQIVDFSDLLEPTRLYKKEEDREKLQRLSVSFVWARRIYAYLVGKTSKEFSWFAIRERI